MKYPVIYADPPWQFENYSDKGDKRSAENHYITQGTQWICDLPVADVATDDCALLMWATYPCLPDALRVIEAWGFAYKTCAFTWVKLTKAKTPSMGLGFWTRSNAEICILATKGTPKRVSKGVRQVLEYPETIIACPRGKHSAKPEEAYARIEQLLDGPYLELFHRPRHGLLLPRENWRFEGNEVDGKDMAQALRDLAAAEVLGEQFE